MSNNCDFCFKKLSKITIDSNLLTKKLWKDDYLKLNTNIFFYNINKKLCLKCGIEYAKWKYHNKKINFINKRKIGINNVITFPININKTRNFDYCVICKKNTFIPIETPIHLRNNYIECFGQLCSDCNY